MGIAWVSIPEHNMSQYVPGIETYPISHMNSLKRVSVHLGAKVHLMLNHGSLTQLRSWYDPWFSIKEITHYTWIKF